MRIRKKNYTSTPVTFITHLHSASSRERVVAARADDDVMANATNTKQHIDIILISAYTDDSVRIEMVGQPVYSTSQEICTRFLLCCALLWLYIDWFTHIHQAYFTGTVAIRRLPQCQQSNPDEYG